MPVSSAFPGADLEASGFCDAINFGHGCVSNSAMEAAGLRAARLGQADQERDPF